MDLVDHTCRRCGAALPPQSEAGVYRCIYCGSTYEPAPPPPPAPVVEQPPVIQVQFPDLADIAARRAMAHRQSNAARGIGCVVPLLVAAGMFVAFETVRKPSSSLGPVPQAKRPSTTALAPAERMYWDSVGGPPQPTTVNGAPAVLGRVRVGTGDQLYVVAVTPATGSIAWRYGPLGSYSQGYRATSFVAVQNRVVVSDYDLNVHVVDGATGKEISKVKVTDRVDRMCVAAGGRAAWIGTVDKKGTTLDVTTGTTKDTPAAPGNCEDLSVPEHFRDVFSHPKVTPKVPGFASHHVRVDGDVGVSAGGKSPGTEIPMAVGFDPKTGASRWTVTLPAPADVTTSRARSNEHDALAQGIYVTMYGTGQKAWHIVALEPRSGTRLWDVVLPKIFAVDSIDSIATGGGWVYVTRTSSLAVLNATTGKLAFAVGDETYE